MDENTYIAKKNKKIAQPERNIISHSDELNLRSNISMTSILTIRLRPN